MRTMNRTFATVAVVALAGLTQIGSASAQLANASAATLGVSSIATVRQFGAIAKRLAVFRAAVVGKKNSLKHGAPRSVDNDPHGSRRRPVG